MAASPAENRVSFRSKETIGFADAMYSITLIQVDTSFNGLEGSGSTQISAAARLACKSSSETKPVNSTQPSSCSVPARSRKYCNESPDPTMTQWKPERFNSCNK